MAQQTALTNNPDPIHNYKLGDLGPVKTRDLQTRCGGKYGLVVTRAKVKAYRGKQPPLQQFRLGLEIADGIGMRWNFGTGWIDPICVHAGAILAPPPVIETEWEVTQDHELLVIDTPLASFENLLRQYGQNTHLDVVSLFKEKPLYDATTQRAMLEIWHETAIQSKPSQLLIDGLWQVVVAQLLYHLSNKTAKSIHEITAQQLAKIDKMINSQLAERIETAHLAALLDMNTGQFTRNFRSSTGASPYQYILQARVARARELLGQTRLPLNKIAEICGFASQSHLTDVFKMRLGTTPGQYRSELRH